MQIRFWKFSIVLCITLFFAFCKQPNAKNGTESLVSDTTKILDSEEGVETYKAPNIPSYIADPKDQTAYYFLHYWDNFDFQDSSKISSVNYIEQAYVDYLSLLPKVPFNTAKQGIVEMLTKADVNENYMNYFSAQYLKYLYDGNSPFHNDRFLEPALQYFVRSKYLNSNEKIRLKTLLSIVSKNQEGNQATDFQFRQNDSKSKNLFDIQANSILLIFYDPGCHSCQSTINSLKSSQSLKDLIAKNSVQIVAIYSGEDLSAWQKYQSSIPSEWINGIDKDMRIVKNGLYDLKVSPTIYLLNKDKNVLLKDLNLSELEGYLNK